MQIFLCLQANLQVWRCFCVYVLYLVCCWRWFEWINKNGFALDKLDHVWVECSESKMLQLQQSLLRRQLFGRKKKKTKQKSCLWWISKRLDVLVDSTRREVESNCVHNNNYYASDSIRTIEQKKTILLYDQQFCKFCKSPIKITHA